MTEIYSEIWQKHFLGFHSPKTGWPCSVSSFSMWKCEDVFLQVAVKTNIDIWHHLHCYVQILLLVKSKTDQSVTGSNHWSSVTEPCSNQLRILNESDPKSAEWINPLKVKVSSERLVQMNVKENIDALTTISSEYESWSVTHVNVMSSSQIKVKMNVLNHKFQVKAKQTY